MKTSNPLSTSPSDPTPTLRCDSAIEAVQLYARGALVTRRAVLPEHLPTDAEVTILLDGLSPQTRLGSVRVTAEGGRVVVGLDVALVLPQRIDPAQGLKAEIETLKTQLAQEETRQQRLRWQREGLLAAKPDVGLKPRRPSLKVGDRIAGALAVDNLLDTLCAELDADLRALGARITDLKRTLSAAELALNQASSAEAQASDLPPRAAVRVKLGASSAPLTALCVVYEVPAARWWPAYTVRLDTRAATARVALEAFIAQDTFEDWPDVALELITADLSREIALPSLASLRLGRPRPPMKRTGLRPPPEGLDLLFSGFDALLSTSPSVLLQAQNILRPSPHKQDPNVYDAKPHIDDLLQEDGAAYGQPPRDNDGDNDRPYKPSPPAANTELAPPQMQGFAAPPPMPIMVEPQRKSRGGVLSALGAVVAAPVLLAGAAAKGAARGLGARSEQKRLESSVREESYLGASDMPFEPDADQGPFIESEESLAFAMLMRWLNFDLLVMSSFQSAERRGRLRPRPQTSQPSSVGFAKARVEAMDNPPGTQDPAQHRGEFDHRYKALGKVEIPSDGRPHRVPIATAEGPYQTRFRAVPAELDQVFRLVDVTNPFDGPLLPGPADIFMDGALVITSPLSKTDKGGTFVLGLGVEDRLRVARNVRTNESRRGLLRGTTHIENTIHIEATSALPIAAHLEVIDRVPVSDATDVSIAVLASTPEPEVYAQDALGQPIRGGRRWTLHLAPGATAEASLTYAIELPSKLDIIGGGHRE